MYLSGLCVVVVVVVVGFLWLGKKYYHTARSVILLILWIRIFVQKWFMCLCLAGLFVFAGICLATRYKRSGP
jgi:hypothetical protein